MNITNRKKIIIFFYLPFIIEKLSFVERYFYNLLFCHCQVVCLFNYYCCIFIIIIISFVIVRGKGQTTCRGQGNHVQFETDYIVVITFSTMLLLDDVFWKLSYLGCILVCTIYNSTSFILYQDDSNQL